MQLWKLWIWIRRRLKTFNEISINHIKFAFMKKTLLILFCLPFIGTTQNRDKFNLDIARELGICYDELTPIEDDPEYHYPLCSDSTVRVFFLEPNYYLSYIASGGWCGSAGCAVDFYKKENNQYIQIPASVWIGNIDIHQEVKDYVVYNYTYKRSFCWSSYSAKIKVKNDKVYFDEIIEYKHLVNHKDSHEAECEYSDSLWLLE